MDCLICRDPEREESLVSKKICLCKEPLFHYSCLKKWSEKTTVPRCPHCKALLELTSETDALIELVSSGGRPLFVRVAISVLSAVAFSFADARAVKVAALVLLACNFLYSTSVYRPESAHASIIVNACDMSAGGAMILAFSMSLMDEKELVKELPFCIWIVSVSLATVWYRTYVRSKEFAEPLRKLKV